MTFNLTCWIFASVLFTNPPSVCCSYLQFENTPLPFLMPVDLSFHVFPLSTFKPPIQPISHLSLCFAVTPRLWYSSVMYRKADFCAPWMKWPFHCSEWLLPPPADTQQLLHSAHWASDRQRFEERYHRVSFSSKRDATACSILQTLLFSHLLLKDLDVLWGVCISSEKATEVTPATLVEVSCFGCLQWPKAHSVMTITHSLHLLLRHSVTNLVTALWQ